MAEDLRLEAIAGTSYPRLADRVEKVRQEERYHREHAQNWLERLTSGDDGRERVQSAVDRLVPYALTLFEPADGEDAIDALGIRTESLDSMREQWLDTVVPFLASLGVDVPQAVREDDFDSLLPEAIGRDGSHTEAWPELHEEMTRTYRELGRTEAHRIMPDPDDAN